MYQSFRRLTPAQTEIVDSPAAICVSTNDQAGRPTGIARRLQRRTGYVRSASEYEIDRARAKRHRKRQTRFARATPPRTRSTATVQTSGARHQVGVGVASDRSTVVMASDDTSDEIYFRAPSKRDAHPRRAGRDRERPFVLAPGRRPCPRGWPAPVRARRAHRIDPSWATVARPAPRRATRARVSARPPHL